MGTKLAIDAKAPRSWRRSAGDKTRLRRWFDAVDGSDVSRGCRAWAMTLGRRSNATAKPVWGYQTGQAKSINCDERTVRRYRGELERAGLVETQRGEVIRHPDGTFSRQMTNRYCFLVPPRPQKSRSHRADTDDRINPIPSGWIETLGRDSVQMVEEDPPPPAWGFDRSHFQVARQLLRPTH